MADEQSAKGRQVGVLVDSGFHELEFWYPVLRLREEGIPVVIIGPDSEAQLYSQLEYPLIAELSFEAADPSGLAAVVIPGGAVTTKMLADPRVAKLVSAASKAGAVMAAISSGEKVLAQAGVQDGTAVTAASADDLPTFFSRLLEHLAPSATLQAAQ